MRNLPHLVNNGKNQVYFFLSEYTLFHSFFFKFYFTFGFLTYFCRTFSYHYCGASRSRVLRHIRHQIYLPQTTPISVSPSFHFFTFLFSESIFSPPIYVCVVHPAELALIGQGLRSGLVVSSGHFTTQIVPVWEGLVLVDKIRIFPVAGMMGGRRRRG